MLALIVVLAALAIGLPIVFLIIDAEKRREIKRKLLKVIFSD
mgnify:CR=1 FL=1